jgi:hypothetical protein
MQREGPSLQFGQKIHRALHRNPLMIEAQAMQPAEFFTIPSAARAAVMALRHYDAVAGMDVRNRGLDHQQTAMLWPELGNSAREERVIVAIDRRNQ